ncbi:MAG: UbiD family decarboxylase, partial [candidate division KSB1 bacterium]|nr:UbiD family decarboxylase [candidate division KSB1 bacterium]
MMDFRQWLARQEQLGALHHITEPASPYLQVSHQLIELEPKPVIFDDVSGYRVAGNIFCSRDQFAECLQIPKAGFLSQLSRRLTHHEAKVIDRQAIYGDHELPAVDLRQLPILFHYPGDGGHYITSAVWIVHDPLYGRNLSYHRMMVFNERQGSVRVVENRGMSQALAHTNGKATVAICISPPPAVSLAASFSPPYQVDEMELAGKLDTIELANCKTIDIKVPVNCEMVLEGHFTGQMAEEGPFVDITGTWDVVRRQP